MGATLESPLPPLFTSRTCKSSPHCLGLSPRNGGPHDWVRYSGACSHCVPSAPSSRWSLLWPVHARGSPGGLCIPAAVRGRQREAADDLGAYGLQPHIPGGGPGSGTLQKGNSLTKAMGGTAHSKAIRGWLGFTECAPAPPSIIAPVVLYSLWNFSDHVWVLS